MITQKVPGTAPGTFSAKSRGMGRAQMENDPEVQEGLFLSPVFQFDAGNSAEFAGVVRDNS